MAEEIGDCIDVEEWFGFGSTPGFTHTVVNRNFCGPHWVVQEPGQFSIAAGRVLSLEWPTAQGSELRRFTFAVFPIRVAAGAWSDRGYLPGDRGLNRMAYAWAEDAQVYRRTDRRKSVAPDADGKPYTFDQEVTAEVAFGQPWSPGIQPSACRMTVTLEARVTYGVDLTTEVGKETIDLPCHVNPEDALPRFRITADGYENSMADDSWLNLFERQGIWKRYSSLVSNALYDSFRPVLFFASTDAAVLYHDVDFAWYTEMKNAPPDKVE